MADIKAAGGQAIAVKADVSKQPEVARLFAETRKSFGAADILVNNAGVYTFTPFEQVDEAQFRRMFDLNVLGLLYASQEAVK